MPDLAALARGLLPPGCAVAAADPRVLHPLMPGEETAGMVPKRRAEFSAGRHAARQALAQLGLPAVAIPQGQDRAPVWPAGVAGTITHCDGACLAAVSVGMRGLGLDLEPDRPLDPQIHNLVLLPEDEVADPANPALVAFCAKEAAYKAQYALSRMLFGFDRLILRAGPEGFTATFREETGPFAAGRVLQGRLARSGGFLLAAAWL